MVQNKMQNVILYFSVSFRLWKLIFHVFNIILIQGDSFLNLKVFNVRLYHWHLLIAIIPLGCYTVKHFNHFEFVKQLSLIANDGS
jgi:hypothetical protein